MYASYHCNDNAIQFPCLEPILSLFSTASEQGMRWNITLSSNSRSLQDKMPSTLPSLTQYGFIFMTSYLISQYSETTHGQKLEHRCWLNWLDYGNVLNAFHIGHFDHSCREWVDFAEVLIILELLLSGGNTDNSISDKTVESAGSGGGCAILQDNKVKLSCTIRWHSSQHNCTSEQNAASFPFTCCYFL